MAKGGGSKARLGRRMSVVPSVERLSHRLRISRMRVALPAEEKKRIVSSKIRNLEEANDEARRRFGKLAVARIKRDYLGKAEYTITEIGMDAEGYLSSKMLGKGKSWKEAFEAAGNG